jgi:hypothetical protein
VGDDVGALLVILVGGFSKFAVLGLPNGCGTFVDDVLDVLRSVGFDVGVLVVGGSAKVGPGGELERMEVVGGVELLIERMGSVVFGMFRAK